MHTAVCRGDPPVVEISCDLTQRPSGRTLGSDVVDDLGREDLRPSSAGRRRPFASRPPPFGDQSLEFVNGDELRAPWHLDGLDQRKDAAVERRPAHAERRGRLRARVSESPDTRRFSNDLSRRRGRSGTRVSSSLLASASQAAARHPYSVHKW